MYLILGKIILLCRKKPLTYHQIAPTRKCHLLKYRDNLKDSLWILETVNSVKVIPLNQEHLVEWPYVTRSTCINASVPEDTGEQKEEKDKGEEKGQQVNRNAQENNAVWFYNTYYLSHSRGHQ